MSTLRTEVTAKTIGVERQCPVCGCTERTKAGYSKKTVVELTPSESEPWTHLVSRRCKCKRCGKKRIDYSKEIRDDQRHQQINPTNESTND